MKSNQFRPVMWMTLAAAALSGCAEEKNIAPATVRPMPVFEISGSSTEERTFVGRAKAVREVNLAARVSGPLVSLPVSVGDVVSASDVLLRIDPQDYKTALIVAQGRLDQVKSEHEFAQREHQRVLTINTNNSDLISPSQLDMVTRNKHSAEAAVVQAQAALQQAKDNLDYTYLRAPFNGQVTAVLTDNFEEVAPKQVLVRILDTSRLEMVVDIPEKLISSAQHVTSINVRFDAFPNEILSAQIKKIGTEADPVTRTYPVTLIMDQLSSVKVLPGMAGRATGKIVREDSDAGFFIPVKAVGQDSNSVPFVWRLQQGRQLEKVSLQSAVIKGGGIVVTGDLKSGDQLAVAGIYKVADGQVVKPYVVGE